MPDTRVQAPGTFCWCEVGVGNVAAAKQFYGGLFGWNVCDVPAGEGATYGMIQLGGRDVGGMYALTREMTGQGVPPHWLAYVKVRNVEETAAKVEGLGGRVVMGPCDVMTAGRMAVIQDPTGGAFALWEAREHAGAAAMGETGTPCWFELISTDKTEAGAFYAALLDWKLESFLGAMDYTLFKSGEMSVGGLMQRTEEMGPVPSHWMIYFAVADCDASMRRAEELGGRLVAGPMDVPTIGRFAILADPDGAMFAVIRLAPPGDV
jgi:predicted enzyme related to lactoylglutathione lyase